MRTGLVTTIICFLALAPCLRAEEDEGLKLLRQGIERLERGDYEGALAKFRDAQIERPESKEIHFNVGMTLYKLERFAEARTAFEAAGRASDPVIERKTLFHVGNCYVKEGKYQEALDAYNRAIALDADYEAAKQNREWVVRKMKELARKQKEQEEKQKEERRIIEKLQEIIQEQSALHGSLRFTMREIGRGFGPSRVKELGGAFDGEVPAEFRNALRAQLGMEPADEEVDAFLVQVLEQTEPEQSALLEKLRALIVEAAEKLEAGGAQPGGPQGGDPEVAKLQKAMPHLETAELAMERASRAAGEELDAVGLHAGQEAALEALFRALNELLDELSRLIKDQAMLLKEGYEFARLLEDEQVENRPDPATLRDRCVEDAQGQKGLRDRTEALAKAFEGQIEQLREAAEQAQAPGGQGTRPGEDPRENLRRMETALGHVNEAAGHMELAEAELLQAELQNGLTEERQALEELVKARAALQPPPQGGNQQSDQQDKNQDNQDQQENQDSEQGEGEPKDGDQQQEPRDPGDEKQDAGKDQQEGNQAQEMSEEQAQKTLDRVRQRELDRRREELEEQKRKARGGRRKVEKDW